MLPLPMTTSGSEEDYPMLSSLNQILFCRRRCYLMRVEGLWQENVHTLSGTKDHSRVHSQKETNETGIRQVRGLRLLSHRLKIQGVADLVEFHLRPDGATEIPLPVEFKRGKRKKWDNDDVQLCAQALCLEEMLGVIVPEGAVYSTQSKRRRTVAFDADLREKTTEAIEQLHELMKATVAPSPVLHPKCKQCSVHSLCMPELLSNPTSYHSAAKNLFLAPAGLE